MNAWYANLFTGLFTRFGPMSPRPHDPVLALSSGVAASWLPQGETTTASGIGWDEAAAEGACVGEAIERLQCGPLPDEVLVRARFEAWPLPEPPIAPSMWVLFHPDQYRQPGFPFQPLTGGSLCDWVCCRRVMTGEPWWIPAELAYLHLADGHRFCPGYSTGLAAGRTGAPILLRGLQEVIERDAIAGAWWGRYPLEEFSFSSVLAQLDDEAGGRIMRPNLTYRCLRVFTPFSAHATMVTLEGEDREGYCFSIGSACRETRAASWMKSLLEAIHGRHYVRYLKAQVASGTMRMDGVPRSFAEHAVYYSLHGHELRLTILGDGATPADERREPSGPEPLARLLERLGPEQPVLFRNMTPPGLGGENLGWHVVRVVVPGLQPLHGHHSYPHLGGPLWSPRSLADWRTIPPHPFP